MNLMDGGELDWPTAHVVPAARVHNHVIACAFVEIWMVGYLLVIGVKTVKPDEPSTVQGR